MRDAVELVAARVMGLVERAGGGEGVAREERPGRVEADGGVEVGLPDGVGLVHDQEEFRRVEAVDVVRVVGGEADGEPLGGDGVASLGELSAEGVFGGVADGGELLPEDLAHLALGGGEDDDLCLGACFDPPEDEAGERPALAAAVRADDGNAAGSGDGAEHLALLRVGLPRRAEDVLDESGGVVPVLWIADLVVHANPHPGPLPGGEGALVRCRSFVMLRFRVTQKSPGLWRPGLVPVPFARPATPAGHVLRT